MRIKSIMSVLIITLSLSTPAFANVSNGGFETSNTTDWTLSDATSSAVVDFGTYNSGNLYGPPEGHFFLQLTAGSSVDIATTASQQITLNKGGTLGGLATFDGQDVFNYNDFAYVRILSGATQVAQPWYRDISQVGNYGNTDWENWSWTATDPGTYTLEYGVANSGDYKTPSLAGFDANPVPAPSTYLLLTTALGAVGYVRRKTNMKGVSHV
jgi:hypothetical protein